MSRNVELSWMNDEGQKVGVEGIVPEQMLVDLMKVVEVVDGMDDEEYQGIGDICNLAGVE